MSDFLEIWAFCTICSKNLNSAHGSRNDCAHHVVTNFHLEFAILYAETAMNFSNSSKFEF